MTDHISDEIDYQNYKYVYSPEHLLGDHESVVEFCGKTNERGMCLNCGLYTEPLNPLPPIIDDDIPF